MYALPLALVASLFCTLAAAGPHRLDAHPLHNKLAQRLARRGTPSSSSKIRAPSTASPVAVASTSASASSAAPSASAVQSTTSTTHSYFAGASSYYLFALPQTDRLAVLDAIAGAGMSVVRIFISAVQANNKGSGNAYMQDLEPSAVGTYDDTILRAVDQLMLECSARGLKLLIALGDRYALGFWSVDAYALKYGIVKAGTAAVATPKIADADGFYTSSAARAAYDNRIMHILSHKNTLMGNKTWAQLDSVIYAFEAQNEAQGYMTSAEPTWRCDRASTIQKSIPASSNILVSTGGGTDMTLSLGSWALQCANFDVVSIHSYDNSEIVNDLASAKAQASAANKTLILGEWGATGSTKAAVVKQVASAAKAAGVPSMLWEVVKPGAGSSDFEIWTDEAAWSALKAAI